MVDLVRFELTTSSMPFKKYQSLADVLRQNKGLSTRHFGRQWTPRGALFLFWTPHGLQKGTPAKEIAVKGNRSGRLCFDLISLHWPAV